MDILESLYENKITFPTLYERKMSITHKKTFVYGPKLSGKTSIIWNYLKNLEEDYLYIDLDDFRYEKEELYNIESFLEKKKIKVCVIENYTLGFPIPKVEELILSSLHFISLDNFTLLKVMPLDFEEYLLFDTKHQSTINSFNSFLKYGNIPEIIDYKDYKKSGRNKELIQLYDTNSNVIEILKLCIKSSGELKSPFWLFNILKKKIKISKDFFYKTIKSLENNNTIILCPKYNQSKAVKKVFSFNFALIDIVSSKKNFANLFANMIFLELFNQNRSIFYLDYIDFYTPHNNTIIISLPFYNSNAISKIFPKLLRHIDEYKINRITIVTISNFDTIFIDTIEAQIVPFYEWAIGK
jgi:GTPase SAR1 family protein